ncbi:MAG: molybdenum cofactor biosynthesis protein B [Myxococcota bacterium]
MPIDESLPFHPLRIALLTVSDTRTLATDESGAILEARVRNHGHEVTRRELVKDDADLIATKLEAWCDAEDVDVIITTGGTGLTGRDVTPEAFARVWEKEIPGFGELFRWLSFQKIGTSTVQSRATAGVARGTYLFALPGSKGAVKDGWDGILETQLDNRHRPCNFAELVPRLRER